MIGWYMYILYKIISDFIVVVKLLVVYDCMPFFLFVVVVFYLYSSSFWVSNQSHFIFLLQPLLPSIPFQAKATNSSIPFLHPTT